MENKKCCDYKSGTLPTCAPLGIGTIPMQQCSTPRYDAGQALARGTLFPGLDLPFMNVVNTGDAAGTPLGELMALGFVVDEMRLYMDTHPDDAEAFQSLKEMIALAREAHSRYVKKYGPVKFDDVALSGTYTWIGDPWPWNYPGKEGC